MVGNAPLQHSIMDFSSAAQEGEKPNNNIVKMCHSNPTSAVLTSPHKPTRYNRSDSELHDDFRNECDKRGKVCVMPTKGSIGVVNIYDATLNPHQCHMCYLATTNKLSSSVA